MKKVLSSMIMAVAVAFGALAADGYIESDGALGAGILTDYKLKPTSRIEVDFALTTTDQGTSGARLFGADYSHTALMLSASLYVGGSENSLWVIHLGNGSAYDSVWPKDGNGNFVSLDTDRHTAVIDFPNPPHLFITGSVTNEIPNEDFTPESFINEATKPIALFARQNASGVFEKQSKARIYGARIFEGGVLVRDYMPCVKDGMPGFKDTVGGGFFCNPAAETHFTSGGDVLVEESPYVATPTGNNTDSSKHLYIDTGYYPSGDMRLELDYALQEAQPSGTWYLFSGTSRFCSYLSSSGIGYGVLSTWGSKSIAKSVSNIPGVRRTTLLDIPNRFAAVMTAGYTNDTLAITNTATYSQTATIKIGSIAAANDYFASMKIYGCRIYESGTLVRDFRPYVIGPAQDGSAIVGLKDEITGAFVTYPAATTSKRLSCGGTLELPPYVESTGTTGLDIGYKLKDTTRIESDFAVVTTNGTSTGRVFGADRSHTALQLSGSLYIDASGYWRIHVGNGTNYKDHYLKGGATSGTLNIFDTQRHVAVIDYPRKVFSIDGINGQTLENGFQASPSVYPVANSECTETLSLFARKNASEAFEKQSKARIYGVKIYENAVLAHDFVPSVEDGAIGFKDTEGNLGFVCNATAQSGFTYGGAFKPAVTQSAATVKRCETATLTASAPGASSYRWLCNGETIEGGANGTLTVPYRKLGETDSFLAIAIYTIDAATAESIPSEAVTVEYTASSFTLIMR